jgi:hypothetical protein
VSLGARALVSLANAKAYCNIPTATTDWDTVLEMIIDAVSDMVSRYVDWTLAKTTYTNVYFDGNGEADFLLPNRPIVSITSIYEDDTLLVEGDDNDYVYYADEGKLYRIGGSWLKGPKTIKITYAAGYIAIPGQGETATLPNDLKLAVMMQVAAEWKRHQQGDWGETSRSFPDGSVTKRSEDPLLPQVKAILNNYLVPGE